MRVKERVPPYKRVRFAFPFFNSESGDTKNQRFVLLQKKTNCNIHSNNSKENSSIPLSNNLLKLPSSNDVARRSPNLLARPHTGKSLSCRSSHSPAFVAVVKGITEGDRWIHTNSHRKLDVAFLYSMKFFAVKKPKNNKCA